jgi:hypothetical protein
LKVSLETAECCFKVDIEIEAKEVGGRLGEPNRCKGIRVKNRGNVS